MARHKIKKFQVFWSITGIITVWVLVWVFLKVWHVASEPEKALKEEQRHRPIRYSGTIIDDTVKDTISNLSNIKDGKFTERAKFPRPPEKRAVIVPAHNGEERAGIKEPTKSYYGDAN